MHYNENYEKAIITMTFVYRPSSAHGKRDSDESPDDDNDVDWSYHVDKKGM